MNVRDALEQALSAYEEYLVAYNEFLQLGKKKDYNDLIKKNEQVTILLQTWQLKREHFNLTRRELSKEEQQVIMREFDVRKSELYRDIHPGIYQD